MYQSGVGTLEDGPTKQRNHRIFHLSEVRTCRHDLMFTHTVSSPATLCGCDSSKRSPPKRRDEARRISLPVYPNTAARKGCAEQRINECRSSAHRVYFPYRCSFCFRSSVRHNYRVGGLCSSTRLNTKDGRQSKERTRRQSNRGVHTYIFSCAYTSNCKYRGPSVVL